MRSSPNCYCQSKNSKARVQPPVKTTIHKLVTELTPKGKETTDGDSRNIEKKIIKMEKRRKRENKNNTSRVQASAVGLSLSRCSSDQNQQLHSGGLNTRKKLTKDSFG